MSGEHRAGKGHQDTSIAMRPGQESAHYFMGRANAIEHVTAVTPAKRFETTTGPISVVSVWFDAGEPSISIPHFRTFVRSGNGLSVNEHRGSFFESETPNLSDLRLVTQDSALADALFDAVKAIKKGSSGEDLFNKYVTLWEANASKIDLN